VRLADGVIIPMRLEQDPRHPVTGDYKWIQLPATLDPGQSFLGASLA
jgi:hypothetical protein